MNGISSVIPRYEKPFQSRDNILIYDINISQCIDVLPAFVYSVKPGYSEKSFFLSNGKIPKLVTRSSLLTLISMGEFQKV
jgi:hypothetical protein